MTAALAAQSASDTLAVEVRALSHTYKPRRASRPSRRHAPPPQDAALDRVDLQVRPGEIFALLGPNGSGKSTLLRILATVQSARQSAPAGRASVFGYDLVNDATMVRRQLGVVFQYPAIDLKLSAIENLRVHGTLYGLTGSELQSASTDALTALGLADRMHDSTESFSGGMRRRVEIAKALLTRPRLLLMDEASSGLDLAIQQQIWADLRRLVSESGLTVLLTTHLMHEAELADRVAVMAKGQVVAVDTPHALVSKVGGQVLEITPATESQAASLLEQVQAVLREQQVDCKPKISQGKIHLEDPQAPALIQTLSQVLGESAASFRLGRPTLADAYLKLTGQSLES